MTNNENALTINRRFGTVTREGRWLVPAQISVTLAAANARLDFTEAVVDGLDTVRLEVDLGLGSELTLVTPPGVRVVAEDLDARLGDFDNRVTGDTSAPAVLRIEVTGRLHGGGDLKVRAPKRNLDQRLRPDRAS